MDSRVIRIASRESELAMVQARFVQGLVGGEIVGVTSAGDVDLQSPLYKMPGVGVFVKQLEYEVLANRADLAVHCLKDMPTETPEGLTIAAVLRFDVPRCDVVVFRSGVTSLQDLAPGSLIGTSSLRRIAALRQRFSEKRFRFENIRGNLNTRVRKLQDGECDCLVLAKAGLARLGWLDRLAFEELNEEEFLYAPGQAALALECRSDDLQLKDRLKGLEDQETRLRCLAERSFMKELEGVRVR
jgi:hydroxymethylbilane synthase